MAEQTNWQTALGWWGVAGLIGVLLRYQLVYPTVALTYPFLLHAHSHVVLLGWLFNALFLAIVSAFIPSERLAGYRWLWIGFQLAVLGMLVFFPIQGYALGSITFSTLHVFVTYAMAWRIWRDSRRDGSQSARLLGWGLFFLLLSTLGPYAVGVLKAKHMQDSVWYPLSVYFYLHFLYNGWFVFGCLALLFRWLEGWGLPYPKANRFVTAFVVSGAGTLALSALWTDPPGWVWWVAGAAALLQMLVSVGLMSWLWQQRTLLRTRWRPNVPHLLTLAFLSFGVKLLLQLASALPWAAQWAYGQRHLVIAYLHLVFIGLITFFLLAWALQQQRIRWTGAGIGAIIVFFILTESGLLAESICQKVGTYLPFFGKGMLLASVGLWLGVLGLWLRQVRKHT